MPGLREGIPADLGHLVHTEQPWGLGARHGRIPIPIPGISRLSFPWDGSSNPSRPHPAGSGRPGGDENSRDAHGVPSQIPKGIVVGMGSQRSSGRRLIPLPTGTEIPGHPEGCGITSGSPQDAGKSLGKWEDPTGSPFPWKIPSRLLPDPCVSAASTLGNQGGQIPDPSCQRSRKNGKGPPASAGSHQDPEQSKVLDSQNS